jgi:TonB family protein
VDFQNRVLPVVPGSDSESDTAPSPSGSVTVIVQVTETGAVLGAAVAVSSRNASLDQAAVAAANQSTYSAATFNCKPVASDAVLKYDFSDNPTVALLSPPPQAANLEVRGPSRTGETNVALAACLRSVGRERSSGLGGAVRVSTCMLTRRKPAAASEILKKALSPRSMPARSLEATRPEWALAYLRLAQAEELSGQRFAARTDAELALRLNRRLDKALRIVELSREATRILSETRS